MKRDYPRECPVFHLRCAEVDYHVEIAAWEGRDAEFRGCPGWVYLVAPREGGTGPDGTFSCWPDDLRPLTPAAEDLLAAIRAELGQ